MAVYVDESKWPFRGQLYCHMMADSDDELDAMADRIGLRRSWKQPPKGRFSAHYDLAPSKRALAVRHGAVEMSSREMVMLWMDKSKAGQR